MIFEQFRLIRIIIYQKPLASIACFALTRNLFFVNTIKSDLILVGRIIKAVF